MSRPATSRTGTDFDPFDAGVQQCPYPHFARLRTEAPVHLVEGARPMYFVTRRSDVLAVLSDPATYSNKFGRPSLALEADRPSVQAEVERIRAQGYPVVPTLLGNDPPEHTRYRKLVSRAFTARRTKHWLPLIEERTRELIDGFADRGQVELVREFAIPLPVGVISTMLGVPPELTADFKRWSDAASASIGSTISDERRLEVTRYELEFQRYFAGEIESRRAQRRDDLLSDLVNATITDDEIADLRPLDVPEILGILSTLLVAGNDTTTKIITETVRLLVDNPAHLDRIRADPERAVAPVVEESLRLLSPSQGMFRVTTRACSLAGTDLPRGALLFLSYASANRDEDEFPDPDRFDPDRSNTRNHIAFGNGIHFCVGSGLARAEAEIAIRQLVLACDDLCLAPGTKLEYLPSFMIRGLRELPLRFRPRSG